MVVQLSQPTDGQRNFFPDYDLSSFNAFSSAAASPPDSSPGRPVQRQRGQSRPLQSQSSRAGEFIPPEASRRQQVGRGEEVPREIVQQEQPKVVAILKQINE